MEFVAQSINPANLFNRHMIKVIKASFKMTCGTNWTKHNMSLTSYSSIAQNNVTIILLVNEAFS